MRQVTKNFNIVTFKELSNEAQEKVRKRWETRERHNWDHHEQCEESLTTFLGLLGFAGIKVLCSQSWFCQGDGSSFRAKWIPELMDVSKVKEEFPTAESYHKFADQLAAWYAENKEVWRVIITNDGRYCHSGEMLISDVHDENGEYPDSMTEAKEKELREILREIADDYHDFCEKDYEYCLSDERFHQSDEFLTQEYYENGKEFNE